MTLHDLTDGLRVQKWVVTPSFWFTEYTTPHSPFPLLLTYSIPYRHIPYMYNDMYQWIDRERYGRMEMEQHLVRFVYSVCVPSYSFGISCRSRSDGAILHFLGVCRVLEKRINYTVVCIFYIRNQSDLGKSWKVDVPYPFIISPPLSKNIRSCTVRNTVLYCRLFR